MDRGRVRYICQSCGHASPKWLGRCPECGEWNSLVEEASTTRSTHARKPGLDPVPLPEVSPLPQERLPTGIGELDRVLGGGIVPGSLVLVGGDPGIGKCVTGDTRVLDPQTGDYLAITAWRDRYRCVLSIDENSLLLSPEKVSAFHPQGCRSILRLTTRLGRQLRCTVSHPMLTADGWRPVGELKPGDRIATPRCLPYFGSEPMPEVEIKLIAHVISEGSTRTGIDVTTGLPEVAADLEEIAAAFDSQLDRHGLRGVRAADKAIPPCIFRLPRGQLALFLRTLFTGDGSVYVGRYGHPGLSYSTISRRLAEDVQHLLLRFGIITKLRTKRSQVSGAPYVAYEVTGHGSRRTQAFVSQIGILGRLDALVELASLAPATESTRTDTVPTGEAFWKVLRVATRGIPFRDLSGQAGVVVRNRRRERPLRRTTIERLAEAYPHQRLQALGNGDVYWDQVARLEPDGEAEAYDLTVPQQANFVANDLIVHNSTLMLQTADRLGAAGHTVLYVTGEESAQQAKMRAERIAAVSPKIYVLAETNLEVILEASSKLRPAAMIVDSIQTMYKPDVPSSPGSVGQVREGAAALLQMAKGEGTAVLLVGHVTKEGAIAGPRVLEHLVDTVLYFEGDRHHAYRILRATKNRFGSTNEIGVFEMAGAGLVEVPNPSAAFLSERPQAAPGSAVVCAIEGTRPLLVEVQALVSPTHFGMPRRTAAGVDYNRLLLLLAVLERRAGLQLAAQDVYVSIAGGVGVEEPAADLGIAVAVASSLRDRPVDPRAVVIGEVGLAGEVRAVPQLGKRLAEAARLGFARVVVPRTSSADAPQGLEVVAVADLASALRALT